MPNHTQTGVIRGGFLQSVAQKGSHRSAILTPSRYRPFTGQVLEEAHHQHLKINHWVYPGTPIASLAIRRSAKPVHFLRKTHLGQDLLDSPKKPSCAQFRQSPSLYPKLFLLLRFLPLEHPTLITKNHWVFQQSARLSSTQRFASQESSQTVNPEPPSAKRQAPLPPLMGLIAVLRSVVAVLYWSSSCRLVNNRWPSLWRFHWEEFSERTSNKVVMLAQALFTSEGQGTFPISCANWAKVSAVSCAVEAGTPVAFSLVVSCPEITL